jgi:hypothetical protein
MQENGEVLLTAAVRRPFEQARQRVEPSRVNERLKNRKLSTGVSAYWPIGQPTQFETPLGEEVPTGQPPNKLPHLKFTKYLSTQRPKSRRGWRL